MANPYSPYDPNEDEARAFGGQLPPRYSGLSDYLRSFTPQQGSTLPPLGAANPVSPLTATRPAPQLDFQAALAGYAPETAPAGLPIPPKPAGLDLEDYAADRGAGAYPGASLFPTTAAPRPPVVDPWNRYDPNAPSMPPLYDDLSRMYQQALARSQNPLGRFFDIAGGRDPAAPALKLLDAMNTMQRQSVMDQQTAEKHQLDRAIQMDNLVKNEREMWTWVQDQYAMLEDPEQQETFLKTWVPRLQGRHGALTQGTQAAGGMSDEDARSLITTPGAIGGLLDGYQDATPAQLAEAKRIYRSEKNPGLRSQRVREYLMGERKAALEQSIPRVQDHLSTLIDTMTQENGGRAPFIPVVEKRAIESIDAAEARDPGIVRRTFGVSPEMAKDAIRLFGTSAAGKTFYEQRGMRASKASQSLTDLKIGEDLATAITEDPDFQKRGISITDFGSLPADEQNRLRVRGQNRLEARKQSEKAEERAGKAVDKAQADRDKPILNPSDYIDRERLRQTGEVAGPEHEITKADVQSGRYLKVKPDQRKDVGSADQAYDQAGTIFTSARGLITAVTPSQALTQKIALEAGAFTGSNPEAKLLKGQTEAISLLARALGEKGVLTDQDVARIKALLPAFGDTVAVLELKQEYLMKLLDTSKQTARAIMLGEDINVYRKRLRVLGEEADRALTRPAGSPKRYQYDGAEKR